MINKIENWSNVKADYGEGKRLQAGGYVCKVMACKQEMSKNNKLMLVVNFDIAEGDSKNYYLERYKNAPRDNNTMQEPKWQGKYYILLEGENYEGRLKAFTTSVEESNEGYTWDWDEKKLEGKLFGGIFREEEYVYNNEIRSNVRIWQVRSVKTIREGNFDVPRKKEVTEVASNNNFVPPVSADELPF